MKQQDRTPPTLRLPGMDDATTLDYVNRDRRIANPTKYAAAKPSRPAFPGPAYQHEFDYERLTGQLRDVYNVMKDGVPRTLAELKAAVGRGTETGLSAALRALRKREHGAHTVNKSRRGDPKNGYWQYWIEVKV